MVFASKSASQNVCSENCSSVESSMYFFRYFHCIYFLCKNISYYRASICCFYVGILHLESTTTNVMILMVINSRIYAIWFWHFPADPVYVCFPQLPGHSVQTRCCLQPGIQSAISLVSVWEIKKVFIQFIYQHISFLCMSVTESGLWIRPFEVNTKEYFCLAAPS